MQLGQSQLLDASVQCLEETPEGYLEGSRLSTLLRKQLPDTVAAVVQESMTPDNRSKGWLRKLLAMEPRITEIPTTVKNEPVYCLVNNAEAAAEALANAPPGNLKRAAERSGLGQPDAKRPRRPPDMGAVAAPDRETLVMAAAEAIGQQDFMEGNRLSKALTTQFPEVAGRVRDALGGKGWLKLLLDSDPDIEQVHVEGRDEPCYRLAGRAPSVLVAQPGISNRRFRGGALPPLQAPVPIRPLPGTLSLRKGGGKGWPAARPASVPLPRQGPGPTARPALAGRGPLAGRNGGRPRSRAPVQPIPPDAPKATPAQQELLADAAVAALGMSQGFLEGSALSKLLSDEQRELAELVRNALGGKGWLRRLFEHDPRVEQIEVEGRGEPCYRLAGVMPQGVRFRVMDKVRTNDGPRMNDGLRVNDGLRMNDGLLQQPLVPGEHLVPPGEQLLPSRPIPLFSKGKGKSSGKQRAATGLLDGGGLNMGQGGLSMGQGGLSMGFDSGRKGQGGVGRAVPAEEVLKRISQEDWNTLVSAAMEFLQDQPFLEGNRLVTMLSAEHTELVANVKAALGGKGWLKSLLELESRVEQVPIENRGEPCYRLVGAAVSST